MTKVLGMIAALAVLALDAYAGFPYPQMRITPVPPPGQLPPYPPGVVIAGQTIAMPHGGVRIWLEMTISGWDPDGLGKTNSDYDLGRAYIMVYNQYLKGVKAQPPSGIHLVRAIQPCSSDADCRSPMTGRPSCSVDGYPILDPSHCVNSICESAFLDRCHMNFQQLIFQGGALGYCGPYLVDDGVQFGCHAPGGIEDLGQPFYFGTLVLDVPENAKGKYTIPVLETYLDPYTWWDGARMLSCHPLSCPFDAIGTTIFIGEDCNNNLVLDEWEIEQGTAADVDQDNIPDECEADCQPNGIPDDYEIFSGATADCDGNNVPDDCDAMECKSPGCRDCNANNVLDKCEIELAVELDLNLNDVPDSCEGVVPAVSTWGLTVMTLLFLIASQLKFPVRASKSG